MEERDTRGMWRETEIGSYLPIYMLFASILFLPLFSSISTYRQLGVERKNTNETLIRKN